MQRYCNRTLAGQRLWKCAQKELTVLFFRSHHSMSDELNNYISEIFISQVFTQGERIKKVRIVESTILVGILDNVVLTITPPC